MVAAKPPVEPVKIQTLCSEICREQSSGVTTTAAGGHEREALRN
ncbi:MAG: hypothetical protein AVDCRST_MAG37-1397 [uncultured Rubrobacteraceae bacterium]|uniref:Uncharacterized protein n=1 Tax=uncultured Rubrobacteraceae bacterium TaxID=349277 RepID=A0A6J4QM29_9ACTN|nr:MAG: hypothetical protein AVDCRST_MAG37-1397 [uncultured Rubrobacteraceae bacterium]